MTALLVLVTLASLGAAIGLLVWVLRLAREERERSEARAAALALLLEGELPDGGARSTAPEPVRAAAATPGHPDNAVAAPAAALTSRPLAFGPAADEPSSRPLLLAAAAALFVVGLVLAGLAGRSDSGRAAAPEPSAPLELLALRHDRREGRLEISGLVRNPRAGRIVQGLEAVADSFGADGAFLTSGRTVFQSSRLAPGEEAPFAIVLTPGARVTRYRVRFTDGRVTVPHVDVRDRYAAGTPSPPRDVARP
jgi:hypothetical protein